MEVIGGALSDPKRPLVAILGGSKVSSKIGVINNLLEIADTIIIGGGMAYTFSAAKGGKVGDSLLEADWEDYANEMVEKARKKGVKLLLPVDTVCADAFAPDAHSQVVKAGQIPDGWQGLDIGPETVELYCSAVKDAGTVIWNGPMACLSSLPLPRAPRRWPRPSARPTPSPSSAAATPRPPCSSWATPTR